MKSASKILLVAISVSLAWIAIQFNPAQARRASAPGWQPEKQLSIFQVSPTVELRETPVHEAQQATPTPQPTRKPKPPPPPSNPDTTQTIIIFGILIVVVVIFGIWLNRNRVF